MHCACEMAGTHANTCACADAHHIDVMGVAWLRNADLVVVPLFVQDLIDKIAQLNASIDEVAAQLKSKDAPGEAAEQTVSQLYGQRPQNGNACMLLWYDCSSWGTAVAYAGLFWCRIPYCQ